MEIVDTHIWTLFQSIREIKNPFKGNLGSHRRNNGRENGKKESMTKHFLSSKRQVRAWLICSCIFLGRVISQISLCYFHKKIISCIILLVRKERRSRSALFGDSKKWWCTHNQITFDLVRKSITYCRKKSYLTGLIFLLGPKEWDPE